jgi:hypothetical protein
MTTPTTRFWIGGRGNNPADNPNDWSPKGKPQPGDTLIANTPTPSTMNVSGDALAGNTLDVRGSLTINMSDNAVATVGDQLQASQFLDIHVAGTDTLTTMQQFQQWYASTKVTVELAPGANLTGSFLLGAGGSSSPQTASLTLTGAAGSTWHNENSVAQSAMGPMLINADVVGSGDIDINDGGYLELGKSVGAGQAIRVGPQVGSGGASLQIDAPNQFLASTELFNNGQIDLMGLATADSYTYQNDMLSIFSGGSVIDTLHLHDSTSNGFVVEPPTAGGSVYIAAITDLNNVPPGLPIHT